MRSIIPEDAQSALPIPIMGPHPRLDRLEELTPLQMKAALIFLSAFRPYAFDYSIDAATFEDHDPGATGEAEPICELCGASIGIFMERGLDWQHYAGDGTTAGAQHIYDPGHTPVVTWLLSEDLQVE